MEIEFAPFMKEALELAQTARGKTAPNPMVGALVVTRAGEILGRGFHPAAGEPHAEVFAINEALQNKSNLEEAILIVTLEPCNHFGRTPPCVGLILKSGIKKVLVGTLDPNPLMQGQSIKALQESGVTVETGLLKESCEQLIRGYATVLKENRPFITIKAATSLDGKIATSSGESKWITDEPSRVLAHEERAKHDAILVGVGTVLADDPFLTVRHGFQVQKLTKVILDSRLLTPPIAHLFESKDRVLIYCDSTYSGERRKILEKAGAEVIPMEDSSKRGSGFLEPGFLDMGKVFHDLASRGVQELLVEGGARVLGAIVREQLFDRIVYFLAPKILGSTSRDVFEGLNVSSLSKSIQIENISAKVIGKDIVIEGRRVHGTY